MLPTLFVSYIGLDFAYLVFGESKRKRRGAPFCLSVEALGEMFSTTSQLIRAEFNDELPESERCALFVKMCTLVADSAPIDVDAIAHEVQLRLKRKRRDVFHKCYGSNTCTGCLEEGHTRINPALTSDQR